jgi:hypothetical protein
MIICNIEEIKLQGPYRLTGESGTDRLLWEDTRMYQKETKGLYFWVVPNSNPAFTGTWWVNYVGMSSRPIIERIEEHMGEFLTLHYHIYDSAILADPTKLCGETGRGLKGSERNDAYWIYQPGNLADSKAKWTKYDEKQRKEHIVKYYKKLFCKSEPETSYLQVGLREQFRLLRMFVAHIDVDKISCNSFIEPNLLLRHVEALFIRHLKVKHGSEDELSKEESLINAFVDNELQGVPVQSETGNFELSIRRIMLDGGGTLIGLPTGPFTKRFHIASGLTPPTP